jgi:hypothetical protein
MKLAEQARALRLRKSGKSVKEIARILHVSQSSASVWCQGVRLSDAHRLALAQRRRIAGAKALAPVNAKRSKARLVDMNVQERNGKQDAGVLTARDVHMFGLGLYWGEGYKRGSLEWGFTNSDPEIITSIIEWLRCCYAIESDRLGARLTINEQYRGESETAPRVGSHHWHSPCKLLHAELHYRIRKNRQRPSHLSRHAADKGQAKHFTAQAYPGEHRRGQSSDYVEFAEDPLIAGDRALRQGR